MKEIKFRLWETDRMLYSSIHDKNWYYTPYNTKEGCHFAREKNQRDHIFPLMQFTGLKDRNSVEIYDGDILVVENESAVDEIGGYSRFECDNLVTPVAFCDRGMWVTLADDEMLWESADISEIIGNIYENKEYL